MCRVLGYIGPTVPVADLMTKPVNSLVNQSFDAEFHHLLQLAGTGFASWEQGSPEQDRPLVYKSCSPAFYDKNLHNICRKLRTNSLLAHIRATGYSHSSSVTDDNCHPFIYPELKLALAHNGGLPGWRDLRRELLAACRPEIVAHLAGNTDTEALYCLLMSQYSDPTVNLSAAEIIDGLCKFMRVLIDLKSQCRNNKVAKLKFFLADGNDLVVANLGLGPDLATEIDQPWEQLRGAEKGSPEHALAGVLEPVYYMAGRDYGFVDDQYAMKTMADDDIDAVIISSEPLTRNRDD